MNEHSVGRGAPSQSEDLAGIENVAGIEGGFHGAMHLKYGRGEFTERVRRA